MKPLTLFGTVLETKNWLTAKRLLYLKKVIKEVHLLIMLKMLNGESRTTDITTENRKTKRISKNITKRKRHDVAYVIYAALP